MANYLSSTRHPWPCLLFLLPLLAVYEGGLIWLGPQAAGARNGADVWLRWGLEVCGVVYFYAAPAIVVLLLALWSWWRWADRPEDPITTYFGMAFESCLFAFGLWQFSRNFGLILDEMGVKLEISGANAPMAQILTFIGAGIYEEVLFRLVLFVGMFGLLRVVLVLVPKIIPLVLAAVVVSLAFAAAHHIGPYGEPMRTDRFVFRTCAGLYFTLLFITRGFGITVGAHAGYNILVGVNVT